MAIRRYFKEAASPDDVQTDLYSMMPTPNIESSAHDREEYIDMIKKSINADRIKILGDPIVKPSCPFALAAELIRVRKHAGEDLLSEAEFVKLVKRPEIFAWAPEKIFPDIHVKCPTCKNIILSGSWTRPKILHNITKQMCYITKEYVCYKCPGTHQDQKVKTLTDIGFRIKGRNRKKFQADSPGTLTALPTYANSLWNLNNSGKILCEASIVDFIRALATRTSWSGIAEAINELKSTAWDRDVISKVFSLCKHFGVRYTGNDASFPVEYSLNALFGDLGFTRSVKRASTQIIKYLIKKCFNQRIDQSYPKP